MEVVRRWEESGLTQRVFCEQENIKEGTFNYWRKLYKEQRAEPSNGFVSLKVEAQPITEALEVIYPNGVKLRIPQGTSPALVRQLIGC